MTEQSATTIQVRLFGALSVNQRDETGNWQEVSSEIWGSKMHSRRLLSFLVFHGRRASRGMLMDQLWPDSDSSFLDIYLTQDGC